MDRYGRLATGDVERVRGRRPGILGASSADAAPVRGRDRSRVHLSDPRPGSAGSTCRGQSRGEAAHDIADALLFLNAESKRRGPGHCRRQIGSGSDAIVVENEARDTRLNRAAGNHEAPSSQILRYLGRADRSRTGLVRGGC